MADVEFRGTFTALVTPFADGGARVDFEALEALCEAQIAGGVAGLVPCGTTGETPTLSDEEQVEVIRRVVRVTAGRAAVVAGTGSNDTRKSVKQSQAALEAGADGVMIVMPYYNKPSQAGMVAHVTTIAAAVASPVIVYNIPGRSVVDLGVEATEQICQAASNVVAIKDATGNVLRCQELKRRLGERLAVMCGDDSLTLGMMAVGASGVISVSSNVVPAEVSAVTAAMASGSWARARELHYALLPLHGAMFVEPNPAPCKAALSLLGAESGFSPGFARRVSDDVRLPLVKASAATRDLCRACLGQLGKL